MEDLGEYISHSHLSTVPELSLASSVEYDPGSLAAGEMTGQDEEKQPTVFDSSKKKHEEAGKEEPASAVSESEQDGEKQSMPTVSHVLLSHRNQPTCCPHLTSKPKSNQHEQKLSPLLLK